MDKKQNMNQKMEQLDKQLFEHYKNKNIPSSTQNAIKTAFKNKNKSSIKKYIYKFATYFISILLLTTGVVFAKDIVNFISSLFTNSTEGIDKAIDSGYVQNVDMDFVYDNGIGIKVDYLVMDEMNLDVSYVYNVLNDLNLKSISINEYNIRDDNNNLLYYEGDDNIENFDTIIIDYTRTSDPIIENDKLCRESILYNIENSSNLSKLIFEITSIILNENDIIEGSWLFEINLQQDMIEENNTYIVSYNKYIKEITTDLSETSFKIEILLDCNFDDITLLDPNSIILTNKLNEEYKIKNMNFKHLQDNNNEVCGKISLEFDVSKYFDNIDELNLYLKITKDKIIDIDMKKT